MRERFLFVFIGLLAGLFVGFVFAGSIRQQSAGPAAQMPAAVSNALDDARREPNNFEAQLKAAELYYQIQRYDDALAYLLKANEIQPGNFEAIANLGMVNLDAGHLDDAETWFKRALVRQPNNASVLGGYCSVLMRQGNAQEAADAVARLERLDPTNPDLPQLHNQLQKLKSTPQ